MMLNNCAKCSEIPRKVRPSDWRPLMQATRDAAGRLVERGLVEITQKGDVVHLSEARGPIRLRLTAAGRASVQTAQGQEEDLRKRKQAKNAQ